MSTDNAKFDASESARQTILLIAHGGYGLDTQLRDALQQHITSALEEAYRRGAADRAESGAVRRENVKQHADTVMQKWKQGDCDTPGCQPSMGICVHSRCIWDTGNQAEHD